MQARAPFYLAALCSVVLSPCLGAEVPFVSGNPLRPIPVVKTWGDLLSQKPLIDEDMEAWTARSKDSNRVQSQMIEDGKPGRIKIRVGMDKNKAGLQDAVLLYCLVEGGTPELFWSDRNCLGPLEVRLEKPSKIQEAEVQSLSNLSSGPVEKPTSAYRLYMKSFPLKVGGSYGVRLSEWTKFGHNDSEKRAISFANITVSEEKSDAWYPWWVEPDKDQSSSTLGTQSVLNPPGGAGLPCMEGWIPHQVPEITDGTIPLPALLPGTPDQEIGVMAEKDGVSISLAEGYDLYWPADWFLTRWLVNGKPVFLKGTRTQSVGRAEGRAAVSSRHVRFDIRFDPEPLGAREGDEIGLQLLFCPKGWVYSGNVDTAENAISAWEMEGMPFISKLLNPLRYQWKQGHLEPLPPK